MTFYQCYATVNQTLASQLTDKTSISTFSEDKPEFADEESNVNCMQGTLHCHITATEQRLHKTINLLKQTF